MLTANAIRGRVNERQAGADSDGEPLISFEFFPPQTEKAEVRLWEEITKLEPLAPRFVSVTYGAGGSTRERPTASCGASAARPSSSPPRI